MLTLKEMQDFAQTYQLELAERQRSILEHYATTLAEAFSEANLAAQQFLPDACSDPASVFKPFEPEQFKQLSYAGPAALAAAFSGIFGKIAQAHLQLVQDIAHEASLPLSVLLNRDTKHNCSDCSEMDTAVSDALPPANILTAPQIQSEQPAPGASVQSAPPAHARQPAKRSKTAHNPATDAKTAPVAAKLAAKAKKPTAKTSAAKEAVSKAPQKRAQITKAPESTSQSKLLPSTPSENDGGSGSVGKAG